MSQNNPSESLLFESSRNFHLHEEEFLLISAEMTLQMMILPMIRAQQMTREPPFPEQMPLSIREARSPV